jgi:hypothetical protein
MDTPFHTLNLRFAGVSNDADDGHDDLLTNDTNISHSSYTHSLKSYQEAKDDILLKKISAFELKESAPTYDPSSDIKEIVSTSDANTVIKDATLQMVKDYV